MPPSGVLPVSPEIWRAYTSWFSGPPPAWSPEGVYVVVDGTLVVGIPLFAAAHGPYALAVGADVNPLVQEQISGAAVMEALHTLMRWAATSGRQVFFVSASKRFCALWQPRTIYPFAPLSPA